MIQSQQKFPGQQRLLDQSSISQRHPVLTPIALLTTSLLLGTASIFGGTVFSVLTIVGVPLGTLVLLCLLVTFVLGIVGVLASIIGILGQLDRYCSTVAVSVPMFLRLKEQSYANRN